MTTEQVVDGKNQESNWAAFAGCPLILAGFSLVILLSLNATASAAAEVCSALFAPPQASFDSSDLNEVSQEFLARVRYLVTERHLLPPEALNQIAASQQPLNPLGERPVSVALLPHQSAFAGLIKDDLQWNLIRAAVQNISNSIAQQVQRKSVAVEETVDAIQPGLIKSFPYQIAQVVRTGNSKLTAIVIKQNWTDRKTTFKSVDLQTEQKISEKLIAGSESTMKVHVTNTGESVFLSYLFPWKSEVTTVDLTSAASSAEVKAAQLQGNGSLGSTGKAGKVKFAGFAEKGGQLVAVTYDRHQAYLFDGFSGVLLKSLELKSKKEVKDPATYGVEEPTGSLGDSVFISLGLRKTFFIDPWGQNPVQKFKKFNVITAFSHQGQRYAFGEDLSDPDPTARTKFFKIVNFDTGESSKSFQVKAASKTNRLFQTFEQDGIFYGLVSTEYDTYLVDLIKGEIKQTLSKVAGADGLRFSWGSEPGHLGFRFKDQYYLLATQHDGPDDDTGRLVILDALSLTPTVLSYPLKAPLISVRMLPSQGKEVSVILNYRNNTSELVSLINTSPL